MAMRLRAICFYTSDPSAVHNAKPDGTAWNDHAYKMFDAQGVETSDVSLAVRTQVDIEPITDCDLVGGWIDLPSDLKGGTTDEWYLSVLGAPDLAAYGKSVDFVSEINLEAVQATRVIADARKTMPLLYSAVDHSGKIRFTVKHPVGASKRFQIVLETFQ